MPVTSVTCCKGEVCSIQECLDHAATRENSCPFTYEVLAAMYATVQNRDYISTTSLTSKCKRQFFFERTTDTTIEPARLWAPFRGTMFHGQLEAHAHPSSIAEARYFAEVPNVGPISCSPDLVDVDRGVLYDYKFTNAKGVPRYGTPWPDHANQVNCNRWIVDHAHEVRYQNKVYDLSAESVRKRFVPMDWQSLILVYMNDDGPVPLQVTRSEKVPAKTTGGMKSVRVPDVWSNALALAWITKEYTAIAEALESGVTPKIPPGFEAQAHPLCAYCDHRAQCRNEELDALKEAA